MSNIISFKQGDADLAYPDVFANRLSAVNLTSANGTTPAVLLTGQPGFIISNYNIQVSPLATVSGGGLVTLTLADSVGGIQGILSFFLPNAGPSPNTPTSALVFQNSANFFVKNGGPNSVYTATLSAALTGGNIRVTHRFILTDS